jgi:hypothetical protein
MAASSTARVTYRSLELAAAAPVSDRPGGLRFVAIDEPPPVRTILSLAQNGGTPIAVEVVEAIEVEAPGVDRGCVVREVDAARLRLAVGSESLANGAAGGEAPPASEPSPSASDSGSFDEGYGAAMAVPAPVVGDGDASEPIDVDGGGDDEGEESGEVDPSAGRTKKRRGRKRR